MGCRNHVPVWHETTKKLRESGKLRVVGIIEEQHPDRCALFLQWKRIDWPILVDSLDLLGVKAVPLTFLLDEHGVIRHRKVTREILDEFLATEYPAPPGSAGIESKVGGTPAEPRGGDVDPPRSAETAETLFLEGGEEGLGRAIALYEKEIESGAPPEARFRLGVALRSRHDSPAREDGDFQGAVDAWTAALRLRPDQYIWRRRLQQYGPRLEKPYAFYDWVRTARAEISGRGETPVRLRVEPRGSELASPLRSLEPSGDRVEEPDPEGRVDRDEVPLVKVEATVVAATGDPRDSFRVHLAFRPDSERGAHWNNEAGGVDVWVEAPEGVEIERPLLSLPPGEGELGEEERVLDFEVRAVRAPAASRPGDLKLRAHALYYVCEEAGGVCQYLRKDIEIPLPRP